MWYHAATKKRDTGRPTRQRGLRRLWPRAASEENMAETQTWQILPTADDVAAEAARRFVALAQQAVAQRGVFTVALAGGTTPKRMYELLAQAPLVDQVPWPQVKFFWSDERFVPLDHPDSNYLAARLALLDHIAIPANTVFPAPVASDTPEHVAASYAATIAQELGEGGVFDLVLLGIGPDGHTASLFPGRPEVDAPSAPDVIAIRESPKPPPSRITFALPLINAAAHVIVLAPGAEKADAVRRCLRPAAGELPPPAGRVRPGAGRLTWLIDEASASQL
ncbi:6-phosphogluconolactonase [Chloroflexia bacterium SDU3-3]|nr:6-phosphogluconolactonase [Chloroflexia bacterium SDU3-3]